MSYKTINVNVASPNSADNIPINLNNFLSDNRPAVNCVLRKSSSGWNTASCLKSYTGNLNFKNSNINYSTNFTYSYDVNDNMVARKVSGEFNLTDSIALIPASGSYSPFTSNSWCMGYSFDGSFFNNKKVLLRAVILGTPNTSPANMVLQWRLGDPTDALSNTTALGPLSFIDKIYGSIVYGYYVGSGTTEKLSIRIIEKTGNFTYSSPSAAMCMSITAKIIE